MKSHLSIYLTIFITVLFFTVNTPLLAGAAGRPGIEPVRVQPAGGMLFSGGLRFEYNRSLHEDAENDYDNYRVFPLHFSYGLVDNFWNFDRLEAGGYVSYVGNMADNDAPDEDGLEGVVFYTKGRWTNYIATSVGFKLSGDADVVPYGNDGTDFFLNVPFRIPAGPGRVIGELGYTFKEGEIKEREAQNYMNYGIGYEFLVDPGFTLRGELAGHRTTIKDGDKMLGFLMGADYRVSETVQLKPGVEFGLDDGSPDYTFALNYEWEFGGAPAERRPLEEEDEILTVLEPEEEIEEEPEDRPRLILSPEIEDTDIEVEDREKAAEKGEEALRAFQVGDHRRAVRLFEEALQLVPGEVEYISNLASIHFHRGDLQAAERHYQKAIEIDPEDMPSHLGLGVTYFQLDEQERARKQFERVLELDPDNRQAKQYLNQLN